MKESGKKIECTDVACMSAMLMKCLYILFNILGVFNCLKTVNSGIFVLTQAPMMVIGLTACVMGGKVLTGFTYITDIDLFICIHNLAVVFWKRFLPTAMCQIHK